MNVVDQAAVIQSDEIVLAINHLAHWSPETPILNLLWWLGRATRHGIDSRRKLYDLVPWRGTTTRHNTVRRFC
jgi:hypothetical protein